MRLRVNMCCSKCNTKIVNGRKSQPQIKRIIFYHKKCTFDTQDCIKQSNKLNERLKMSLLLVYFRLTDFNEHGKRKKNIPRTLS